MTYSRLESGHIEKRIDIEGVTDKLVFRVADPQAYYSRALGKLIHYYAEKRKAMQDAQEAAKRTFTETLDRARARYEREL